MGQYKKENEVSIFQMERWKEILKTREAWGLEKKFDTKFVEQLCKILHEESMRIQNQVMNRSSEA
jgi:chorismate mutase